MIRVLIADDHPVVLAGLSELLRSAGFEIVGVTRNGLDTVDRVRREHPDILIVDLRMPGLDGIGVLRAFSRDATRPKSILLTAEVEGIEQARARALGVDAVILKESALEQLVTCMQALIEGTWDDSKSALDLPPVSPLARETIVLLASGASVSQSAARMGVSTAQMRSLLDEIAEALEVGSDERAVRDACVALVGRAEPDLKESRWLQERYGLTRREASVAALLADGLTNREIGERLGITLNTVKTHISSILSKLDVPTTRRLLAVLSEARD